MGINKATLASVIRALILLLAGYAGQELSESQVNEMAVGAGAFIVLAASVVWARRDDKKLLHTPPPADPPA